MENMADIYSKVLGGAGMPAAPGGPEGEVDSGVKPRIPEDKDPRTQQGETFFVDPGLLHEGYKCKKGEELMVRAKVVSIGSKIALTPLEVVPDNGGDEEVDGEEEDAEDSPEHSMAGADNERR